MTPEKVVLIFALFGSAKVAFDLIIIPFKRKPDETTDQGLLAKALLIAESLSQQNTALEIENSKLRQRLANGDISDKS